MPAVTNSSAYHEVVELLGADAAHILAVKLGGTYLYVPRKPGPEHPITIILGERDALRLAARFAGEAILLPRGRRTGDRARVIALRATTSMSLKQIALATGYHVRQVQRILDDEKAQRQMSLF